MASLEFDLLCAFETHAVDDIREILDRGFDPRSMIKGKTLGRVMSTQPTPATIVLRLEADSESTSLYASFAKSSATAASVEKFPLVMRRWRLEPHVGVPLEASNRDPSSHRSIAFEIPSGIR